MSVNRNAHLVYEVRRKLWSSVRRLRMFSAMELEAAAECNEHQARQWVLLCRKAGWIVPVGADSGEVRGRSMRARMRRFRLVRDLGPVTPVQKGSSLVDANAHPDAADDEAQMVRVPRDEYERALRCVRACAAAGITDPETQIPALCSRAGAA